MELNDKKEMKQSEAAEPVANPNPAANANLKPEQDTRENHAVSEENVNSEITDGEGG